MFWNTASILAGAVLGICFAVIFKKIVPPHTTRLYWLKTGQNIAGLIKGEERRYWQYYFGIIKQTGKYVFRNLVGLAAALFPIFLLMGLWGDDIQSAYNQNAEIAVTPAAAGKLTKIQEKSPSPENHPAIQLTLNNGFVQPLGNPFENYALCANGKWDRLLLELCNFTVFSLEPAQLAGNNIVIVRGYKNDINPLWPYFNDPECLFFLFLATGSLSTAFFLKNRKQTDFTLSLLDYSLTWLAAYHPGMMRAAGEMESRVLYRKLSPLSIEKPVFVMGLARAGTTILLETLTEGKQTASHRYRDFPFVMTPVAWSAFVSVFATDQKPVERPHKDRIHINRESPEAFEEPIWQFFFPHVHDPEAIHRLTAADENPPFNRFYTDHIKKILYIRKGTRYVSKGNYNIARIEYLNHLFKDAYFIILIRHPLRHIESLVRQHERFMAYSQTNPEIPEYLTAAGHYEFGPQRRPICLSPDEGKAILDAWKGGNDPLGYAIQWAGIYGFVNRLMSGNKNIKEHTHIIRYEDLCADPEKEIEKISGFAQLENHFHSALNISAPSNISNLTEERKNQCWREVQSIAEAYGYRKNPDDIHSFSF